MKFGLTKGANRFGQRVAILEHNLIEKKWTTGWKKKVEHSESVFERATLVDEGDAVRIVLERVYKYGDKEEVNPYSVHGSTMKKADFEELVLWVCEGEKMKEGEK